MIDLNAFAVVVLDNPRRRATGRPSQSADVTAYESIGLANRRAFLFAGPAMNKRTDIPDLIVAEGSKIAVVYTHKTQSQ